LFDAPAWVRALFLSAFASAEMATPRISRSCLTNHAHKQADEQAARLVSDLLTSLDFRCSIAPTAAHHLVQIIGGEGENLRFLEQVGFCLAAEKRRAAARAASVAWQRRALLEQRNRAQIDVE